MKLLKRNTDTAPIVELKNGMLIAWKSECFHSTATSLVYNVPLHLISTKKGDSKLLKALSYITNSWSTFRLLQKTKPENVICLNQPPFLPMVCDIYCRLNNGKLILDFHSGALTKLIWRPFLPYYRHLIRKAPFILCHNRSDGNQITEWGGHPVHMISLPQTEFNGISHNKRPGRPLIFFVCSFADDEPIETTFKSMSDCSEYDFIVSGNYKKRNIDPSSLPDHIKLAGFMDYADYLATMAEATAILTLSDRRHIMQMAVYEAMTIGTPVITNESPVLREALGDAGIFTAIDSASITHSIGQAVDNSAALDDAIKIAKQLAWDRTGSELKQVKHKYKEMFND